MDTFSRIAPSPARGFTLIELLVVIAIIGLLSSIVLVSLNIARDRAYESKRFSDIRQVGTALDTYFTDNGSYPVTTGNHFTTMCAGFPNVVGSPNAIIPALVPNYISVIPTAPNPNYSGDVDCYFYVSNGTDYKFGDYYPPNTDSDFSNPKYKALNDPGNLNNSWAVYSPGAKNW